MQAFGLGPVRGARHSHHAIARPHEVRDLRRPVLTGGVPHSPSREILILPAGLSKRALQNQMLFVANTEERLAEDDPLRAITRQAEESVVRTTTSSLVARP